MTFPFISTTCRHAQTAASASGCLLRIDRLSKVSYYVVASKFSRNSLVQLSGIATVNKEMYMASFVAVGMLSEGNAPKNGEPTVGFSLTTMLQHTGRFWSQTY